MDKEIEEKQNTVLEHLKRELAGIRTGRASVVLFESLLVNAYGSIMPLKQIASLSVPDARQILIQPWDVSLVSEIEKAILASNQGVTPTNDGKIIRLTIPPMTEEKRRDLVKVVKKQGEDGKVAVRNIRRESNDALKQLQKEKGLPEDALQKQRDAIQKMTDQMIAQIDQMIQHKEQEILQV